MLEYNVDLSNVKTWAECIAAFNEGFIRPVGGDNWNGNLDAFNDYLSWPDESQYRLIVHGWKACIDEVNKEKTWNQQPVLDAIYDIFQCNQHIEVVLK